jgi:hypothetical protein
MIWGKCLRIDLLYKLKQHLSIYIFSCSYIFNCYERTDFLHSFHHNIQWILVGGLSLYFLGTNVRLKSSKHQFSWKTLDRRPISSKISVGLVNCLSQSD